MKKPKKKLDVESMTKTQIDELSAEIGQYVKEISYKAAEQCRKFLAKKGLAGQLEPKLLFDLVPPTTEKEEEGIEE